MIHACNMSIAFEIVFNWKVIDLQYNHLVESIGGFP